MSKVMSYYTEETSDTLLKKRPFLIVLSQQTKTDAPHSKIMDQKVSLMKLKIKKPEVTVAKQVNSALPERLISLEHQRWVYLVVLMTATWRKKF